MSDPVTDGIIADALASEARAAHRSRSRFSTDADGVCSNCGTTLKGRICHSCGQDADNFHRPVWALFWEIMDGMFAFDGRFWRTIPALMFRPGHVTRQYLSGVRARYVQPFRLYLAASVVLFLLLGVGGDFADNTPAEQLAEQPALSEEQREVLRQEVDEIAADNPEIAEEIQATINAVAGARSDGESESEELSLSDAAEIYQADLIPQMRRSLLPEDYAGEEGMDTDASSLPWLSYGGRRQLAGQLERVIEDPSRMFDAMMEWLPRLLFILLPVYALIIAVGQVWRRGFYFYDHLIVSLHFHTFLFLFFILVMVTGLVGEWIGDLVGIGQEVAETVATFAVLGFLIWSNFYLYKIHRVIYEHGRFMSVLRTLTLDMTYLFVLVFASILLLFLGLMTA